MRILFILILAGASLFTKAQNPVVWKYTAKKTGDKTYEVHVTASVETPWHIYSQSTPEGGPLATRINFVKNPLVTIMGKASEKGKMITRHEDVFDVDVKYFDGNVDFVQTVKLKSNVKTNLTGTVEFMACNDSQCLPPRTISFSVQLD